MTTGLTLMLHFLRQDMEDMTIDEIRAELEGRVRAWGSLHREAA